MRKKRKNKSLVSQNVEFEEIRANVAGIDLAWRADHYVCGPVLENGMPEIASFGTTTPELYRMLYWLQERNVVSVAMESTSVYWIPTADLLESKGIEVVLVDPREVRMVPGRKSDMEDCQWLQKLHRCGLLRGAFRPPEAIAAIRSVLRERESVVSMRVQAIQHMQKSLDQMNIRVHHAVSDIDGVTGTAIIKAIVEGERDPIKLASHRDKRCKQSIHEIADHLTGTWREEHLFNLKQAFMTLQFLDERIKEYDLKISEMFEAIPKPDHTENQTPPSPALPTRKLTDKEKKNIPEKANITKLLRFDMTTIPGISYATAATIVSELGNLWDRFPDEHHFASYIGLAPTLGKSAGKNVRQKRRCKNTSRAGRALRMAAATLYHSKSPLGAYFRSVSRRSDRKTAVKATARRLAHMIYRGVRYGKEYVDCGQETNKTKVRKKMIKLVNNIINEHKISSLDLNIVQLQN